MSALTHIEQFILGVAAVSGDLVILNGNVVGIVDNSDDEASYLATDYAPVVVRGRAVLYKNPATDVKKYVTESWVVTAPAIGDRLVWDATEEEIRIDDGTSYKDKDRIGMYAGAATSTGETSYMIIIL